MFRSVCVIALSVCAIAPAADWPQWRGLNRDGRSAGSLPTWTPPVVANGRLYLREQNNLYSYDIKR